MLPVNYIVSSMTPIQQLTLPLSFSEDFTFDNFVVGKNAKLIASLQAMANGNGDHFIYFSGLPGFGKTHLLVACNQRATEIGLHVFHLPLSEVKDLSPKLIENLEVFDLIYIDDIHKIVENKPWEEAIFNLYNRSQSLQSRLIVTGNVPVKEMPQMLPDLSSRLLSNMVFQIQELSDAEKIQVLQQRAQQRGLQLSLEVGQFLLRYLPRDLSALLSCLDKLDKASLTSQRKLTIPFVNETLKGV